MTGAGGEAMSPARPVRVLLVDDKPIVREGVRALLEREIGIVVVGEARTLRDATACDVDPDAVVVELELPDARGADVVTGLHKRFPGAAVVALTDVDAVSQVESVVAAGVGAYVVKRATTEELVTGIRLATQGGQYLHPSLRSPLRRRPGAHRGPAAGEAAAATPLTGPEREVARLLVLGHTNTEIATLASVSLRTVEARRARVLRKLGVRTRAELVRVAQLGCTDGNPA